MVIQAWSRSACKMLAPLLAALLAGGAWAQPVHGNHAHGAHRDMGRAHFAFHDRDVRRFNHDELGRWRGGRWNNTCFGGRCGWWWFSAGQWYFYEQPVYPYPPVVSSIGFVDPVVMGPPPAPAVVTAPAPFWYYCDNPPGYYPAVQTCDTQFRQMAQPPPQ